MRCCKWLVGSALVMATWPSTAFAAGIFGSVEAGYHRIVPVDTTLATVLDGSKGCLTFGLGAGYEFHSRVFIAVDAAYLKFEPKNGFDAGGRFLGEVPSRVRIIPLVGSLGFRVPLATRLSGLLSVGAGGAQEKQESDVDPRRWNRTNWHATYRLTVGAEYQGGRVGIGAQVAWLFLPAVRTPQLQAIDFGGVSVAGTLSFGRKNAGHR